MPSVATHDPAEQGLRRKRSRISQQAVGDQFSTPISDTAVSDYEGGRRPLPFEFTGDDYEHALARALLAKGKGKGK